MGKNLKKHILLALALTTIIGGGSATVFAASNSTKTSATQTSENKSRKMDFSSLVEDGTINQETADKMISFMESKQTEIDALTKEEKRELIKSGSLFNEMVTSGIISQEQADAATAKYATKSSSKKREKMDLSSLVTNGVIDQATLDKMTSFMESEKTKKDSLTQEEKQALKEANGGSGIFSKMVTEGIITQEQYDAIKAALPQKDLSKNKMDFSSLVSSGTISQETADKITTYMQTKKDEMAALTQEEKQALKESGKSKKGIFSELLEKGIITQEEYDAIKANISK